MKLRPHSLHMVPVALAAALAIFAIDLMLPLGVAGGIPYAAVVLLTLWLPGKRTTSIVAAIASVLTILGFFYSPAGGELWKVLADRGLAIFIIWAAAILIIQRKQVEREREHALAEREHALAQLKVLRGLLPICASCKNIRQESGAWQQLEAYIRDHSEAEFTHSICPDCAEKLYGQLGRQES